MLQENFVVEATTKAVQAMTPEAAQHYMEIGQAYAELYPRPITIELVKPSVNKSTAMMQMLGNLAPSGMCMVHWPTRTITWSNNAYKKVFLENLDAETYVGMRIDDLIPGFNEVGLDAIFEGVATSGVPFSTTAYELMLPSGATYWDWSLMPLPCHDGDDVSLVIQLQQAYPARQAMVA